MSPTASAGPIERTNPCYLYCPACFGKFGNSEFSRMKGPYTSLEATEMKQKCPDCGGRVTMIPSKNLLDD